jgi:hypothetical protein
MYYKSKTLLLVVIAAFTIIACSQALYIPTLTDSQKTGVSSETLVLGRKLYVNNCAGCHSLFQPEQFTIEEWGKVMPSMQKKAKCSEQDAAIIMKYINARAK